LEGGKSIYDKRAYLLFVSLVGAALVFSETGSPRRGTILPLSYVIITDGSITPYATSLLLLPF